MALPGQPLQLQRARAMQLPAAPQHHQPWTPGLRAVRAASRAPAPSTRTQQAAARHQQCSSSSSRWSKQGSSAARPRGSGGVVAGTPQPQRPAVWRPAAPRQQPQPQQPRGRPSVAAAASSRQDARPGAVPANMQVLVRRRLARTQPPTTLAAAGVCTAARATRHHTAPHHTATANAATRAARAAGRHRRRARVGHAQPRAVPPGSRAAARLRVLPGAGAERGLPGHILRAAVAALQVRLCGCVVCSTRARARVRVCSSQGSAAAQQRRRRHAPDPCVRGRVAPPCGFKPQLQCCRRAPPTHSSAPQRTAAAGRAS
jgi:hypothetical protein